MEFRVLLDSPNTPVSRVQVAELGDFSDPRYGDWSITADDVADWKKNLSSLPGGQALIDFEHRSERKPRDSKAAGWINGLELDGDKVMADVEWTKLGKEAIDDKLYKFMSPVYGPMATQTGGVLDNAFQSAALTNKPFIASMPAVMLATAERVSEAFDADPAARFYQRALDGDLGGHISALVMLDVPQAERDQAVSDNNALPDGSYPIRTVKQLKAAAVLAASKHGNWQAAKKLIRRRAKELGVQLSTLNGFGPSDSPRSMDKALLTALELDQDTDLVTALEAIDIDETAGKKLLDAVTGLKAKAEKPEPIKTLEQQAAENGKKLLDQAEFTKILSQAAAGEQAMKQLHAQRFEHTFEAALTNPDGAKVTPAEKEQLHHFYTLDADATIKLIEDREPIVSAKPKGSAVLELDLDNPASADPEQVARAGLHPGSHAIYAKVQARLKKLDKPQAEFTKVMDQMAADGEL